jgi:HD-GYP domain-containing protein (c-di-GMP phosphodiesterase class II)
LINYSFRLYVFNTREYVNKLEEMNTELDKSNLGLLKALGRVIDAYDWYTSGHSAHVAIYAREIAHGMQFAEAEQSEIVRAALIHDIGKVGIAENILSKPGPLDENERAIINRHPEIGAGIIAETKGLHNLVPLVKHHHERWDGGGYPDRLKGTEIPLGARVLCLADAIDAMSSDRPYHKGLDIDEVKKEILRCSGTQFDPDVVKGFLIACERLDGNFIQKGNVNTEFELKLLR